MGPLVYRAIIYIKTFVSLINNYDNVTSKENRQKYAVICISVMILKVFSKWVLKFGRSDVAQKLCTTQRPGNAFTQSIPLYFTYVDNYVYISFISYNRMNLGTRIAYIVYPLVPWKCTSKMTN